MSSNVEQKNIDAKLFQKMIANGAADLKAHLKTVNDLNVFPIPDGDTGDNMYMTIHAGANAFTDSDDDNLGRIAHSIATEMLFNARGNSGVILSQFFAGIAEGLSGLSTASVKQFAAALESGVKKAYSSVIQPVEGTILTVAREAVEYVTKNTTEDTTPREFLSDFIKEMKKSLDRTPELLPVLKEAGVIDSGGAGLLYIAEGMKIAVEGKELSLDEGSNGTVQKLDFSAFTEDSVMTYGYCTEMLLRLQSSKVDVASFNEGVIIEYLNTIGDSIVVVKTDSIVKLHVHTLTPYKVLEYCQRFGEYLTVKIENMTLQHNESHDAVETVEIKRARSRRKFGVVTVATGKGLMETFTEFGADVVIDGGQGKNPSIERFIEAFDETNADCIFVLPNNSNIIMAAKQAAELYEKSQIRVIPTKNFGHAYSVLSMLDYSCDDADEIEAAMMDAMSDVATGMITESIRTAHIDGVDIVEGEYIGFTDKTMLVSNENKLRALESLFEKMNANERSFMIAVYGESVTAEERAFVSQYVSATYPNLEFYEINGEQKVYEFIIILE